MPRQNPNRNNSGSRRSGGNAAAAGMLFQAQVAASFAASLLAEQSLDHRLGLGAARAKVIRLETEAPVDDVLIETNEEGLLFVQAKTRVDISDKLESPLGKTAEQFVSQWLSSFRGSTSSPWSRPLDPATDRFILAVAPGSSERVKRDLSHAVDSLRAASSAPLPQGQSRAFSRFRTLLAKAWARLAGSEPNDVALNSIIKLTSVLSYDFEGADRNHLAALIRPLLRDPNSADAALAALVNECQNLMATRRGANAVGFRTALNATGLSLVALSNYRDDVERLRDYSDRIRRHLKDYETTKYAGQEITVPRACTPEVIEATRAGSLLLVGEPGAGKSAVVSAAAAHLRNEGHTVIELAVDRLAVANMEGLRAELGLRHSVQDVLRNWPGNEPAYLFIDALDATRGGQGESVFRTLIEDIVDMPEQRWKVIASIRTFDLRLGEKFRRLFYGTPPSVQYRDPAFPQVRHVHIPLWSTAELNTLLDAAPELRAVIDVGGERLKELATVSFNTRLLAELVSDGLQSQSFSNLKTQVELLSLYWEHRVTRIGIGANFVLRGIVHEMVSVGGLRAELHKVGTNDPYVLQELLRQNVLISIAKEKYVAFRHHILFDYAASRVYLNADNLPDTAALFEGSRGLGLMLGPALAFTLQELWARPAAGHPDFWRAIVAFSGNPNGDPVARSIAARTASELPMDDNDLGGLAGELLAPQAETATTALTHVIGALGVRVEDGQRIHLQPWCTFAEQLASIAGLVSWPLRTLLFLIVERSETPHQRNQLGKAARALFTHAFDRADAQQLFSAAIGFVAQTFASDPPASRALLDSLFDPRRFETHGHEDVPSLTRTSNPLPTVTRPSSLPSIETFSLRRSPTSLLPNLAEARSCSSQATASRITTWPNGR
jgi:ATPase family associated with various cellular activities (AAA)